MKLPRLKEIRENQGLTQAQLSERVGTSQNHISLMESGMNVRGTTAKRVADGLGCTLDDLTEPTFKLSDLPMILASLQHR